MIHLLEPSPAALDAWFAARNLPRYRAPQIRRWLFASRVRGFDEMSDLPKALRDELAADLPDVKVTPLAVVLRCCAVALHRVPALNASFDAAAGELVLHDAVHLGVATQTDRGLVVPVLRDAGGSSIPDLARGVADLASRARSDDLAPRELRGSTFTVSNVGAFGVDGGGPIINHPEAGILGIGRITERPWVVDGALAVRPVATLSLTFDHRVCDGAEGAGFLRLVADLVERPTRLLAH
jgi:pyruvate dehydrogenase E2 component (dihydrolipoamide acetyltransferase)